MVSRADAQEGTERKSPPARRSKKWGCRREAPHNLNPPPAHLFEQTVKQCDSRILLSLLRAQFHNFDGIRQAVFDDVKVHAIHKLAHLPRPIEIVAVRDGEPVETGNERAETGDVTHLFRGFGK